MDEVELTQGDSMNDHLSNHIKKIIKYAIIHEQRPHFTVLFLAKYHIEGALFLRNAGVCNFLFIAIFLIKYHLCYHVMPVQH